LGGNFRICAQVGFALHIDLFGISENRYDISALTDFGQHNHLGPQEIVVGDFECDGLNKLFGHKPSGFFLLRRKNLRRSMPSWQL